MPRPEFRKSEARRRPSLVVELLEGRQLLNATSVTTESAREVHAEVMKEAAEQNKLVKQEKAEAAKEFKQEKAAAAKLAKQEKAAAKYAKQHPTTESNLSTQVVAVAQTKAKAVKTAKASTISGIMGPIEKTVQAATSPTSGNASPNFEITGSNHIFADPNDLSPQAGQYTPSQLETAYGTNALPAITLPGGSTISNQGQGVTIGIVNEFHDPNIIGDANLYSAQYGLPIFNSAGGPTLTVVKDTDLGGTVSNSPTSGNSDTSAETSLDVELAHAMAPMANIVLIETVNSSITDLLEGIQDAALNYGAAVVSLSYGGGEGASSITANNNYLVSGKPAANVAVTVSTGDSSTPEYPATSPNVVAVGGTSLFLASVQGSYGYETAWGGLAFPADDYSAGAGGGGTSKEFAAPTFQSANGVKLSTFRTIPDVSLVADPYTGVSIYDSWDGLDWSQSGGTSVAAPMFAGVLALAQQQRLDAGQAYLTSVQIDSALYSAYTNPTTYADILNDVTLGKNTYLNARTGNVSVAGFQATTGYDEATGLGSPWAAGMVPYLATGKDPYAS